MSKLSLNRLKSGGRHTVIVKLPFEDDKGNVTNEEMRVVYRGVSLSEGAEIEARAEAKESMREALIDALCEVVLELPDIEDNEGPVQPTPQFFSGIDTFYLNRINQAIREDRQGPN